LYSGAAACGAPDSQPAIQSLDAIGQPTQARSAFGICTADAVIDDFCDQCAVGYPDIHCDSLGLGVLCRVGQAFRDDVIGGYLKRF
jgi:hypothetical protein